jgi:hypothetical protein
LPAVSNLPKEHPFVHQAAVHSAKTSTLKNHTIVALRRTPIEMESAPVLMDKLNSSTAAGEIQE